MARYLDPKADLTFNKAMGFTVADIAKITGLTLEEIEKIEKI